MADYSDTELGKGTVYSDQYDASLLDPIPRNKARQAEMPVTFVGVDLWTAFEISWLNPQGLPQIAIGEFIFPCTSKAIIESKSFKLFMQSFRNHGAFHEDVTLYIAKRIVKEVKPIWLRIGGYFYPRGGIPIDVFWQSNNPPKKVWIPETNIKVYNGRS